MATAEEDLSDSSTSTIRGPVLKKCRHRQQKNHGLECVKSRGNAETNEMLHLTSMNDGCGALQLSRSGASQISKTGDGVQPTVAQNSVKNYECNSDTTTCSGETLKGKQGNSKGGFFYDFARRSHKAPCTPQLQIWAHESLEANLTFAEILEKANWEAARLQKL